MERDEVHTKYQLFSEIPADDPEAIIRSGTSILGHYPIEDHPTQRADIRYRIGMAQIVRGEFEEAFRSLSEARQIHEELEHVRASLMDQLAIGVIYDRSEQPEVAFDVFVRILAQSRESKFKDVEESACCGIGRVCRQQGRYDESKGFLDAAMRVVDEFGSAGHQDAIFHEYGQIELGRGLIGSATSYLEKAAEIAREKHSAFGYEYRITLGELYTKLDRLDEAFELLSECLNLCLNNGIIHGEIQARFHLGNLYSTKGEWDAAGQCWKECYERTKAMPFRQIRILSGEYLAEHYRSRGDFAKAFNLISDIRDEEHRTRKERLHHTISAHDQSMRIDDLEREMEAWRRRSGELEVIRSYREESIRELETIKEIGQQITSTLEPDTIVTMIHDRLSEMVTVDGMLIGFYEKASNELDLHYIIEDGKRREAQKLTVDSGRRLVTWVIMNNRDLIINSRSDFPEGTENFKHIRGTEMACQSFLIVRLRTESRIMGVLSVQALRKERYKARHLKILQALAGFVAIALTNSNAHQNLVKANEKIAHMAAHDPLTGLPNRMQIMNRLGHELNRCRRYGQSLGVLFIDLDGFKIINDTHGHKVGDAVLIEVASRLTKSIRSTDAVGRLAGDEFLIILTDDCTPRIGTVLSKQTLEKLAKKIVFEKKKLSITGSIGLAFYPDDGETPEDLVNMADEAMYEAKALGKNKVSLHSTLKPE